MAHARATIRRIKAMPVNPTLGAAIQAGGQPTDKKRHWLARVSLLHTRRETGQTDAASPMMVFSPMEIL